MTRYSLETIGLRKEYPGTVALKGISLKLEGGSIHALIGKNGAGKSTLVKILAGAEQPTAGSMRVNGKDVHLASPSEALHQGIAAVHQELSLVPGLTVAENVLLGRLPVRTHGILQRVMIDWDAVYERAGEILSRLHVDIDVRSKASSLGVAQQQLIEIAKAMSYNPSVLMLDEPTSALSRHEAERLFDLLHGLAGTGVVLLYITHRLQEIHRVADSVSVLRDGELVGTIDVRDATPQRVVHMMFGETAPATRPSRSGPLPGLAIEVRGLSRKGAFSRIDFSLHQGEILGIAGLLGSGRTALLRAIFGADPPDEGEVIINGTAVRPASPAQMKKWGVALTPEKRKEEGLVQLLSVRANTCLASLERISAGGVTSRRRERKTVDGIVDRIGISVPDIEARVSSLSGGNQQKVVIGKWLINNPGVILLDEPTRGIDLQAKQHMFRILWDLSAQGIAAVVVSSELEELLDLCHRILIMKNGRIQGELLPENTSLEQLFSSCLAQ
jgi:ribose transport system ATP-binding protein